MLAALQSEIAAIIEADPYFEDLDVIPELKKDAENEINIAVGKQGTVIIVTTPTADVDPAKQVPGPYYDNISIAVQVHQNPILNQSGKAALEIAEKISSVLHWYSLQTTGNILAAARPTLVPMSVTMEDIDMVVWIVNFRTAGNGGDPLPQVVPVEMSQDNGVVTATCSTAGVTLFYTTTGKKPSPRNGTVVSGPFSQPSGTRIRCRAWCWGYLPSEIAELTVS